MENFGFLFAAYTAIWVLLFGYLVYIHLRQKKLQREIDRLREREGE
jgi:CcmD family protein